MVTYTETVIRETFAFEHGGTCMVATPYVDLDLYGAFTTPTQLSGTFLTKATTLTCTLDGQQESAVLPASTGTWNGVATVQ